MTLASQRFLHPCFNKVGVGFRLFVLQDAGPAVWAMPALGNQALMGHVDRGLLKKVGKRFRPIVAKDADPAVWAMLAAGPFRTMRRLIRGCNGLRAKSRRQLPHLGSSEIGVMDGRHGGAVAHSDEGFGHASLTRRGDGREDLC